MSLRDRFGWLFESPQSNLTALTVTDRMPLAYAWGRDRAMQVATVARARNIICSYASATRLDLYDGGVKQDRPDLLRKLDGRYLYSYSISSLVDALLFYGVAAVAWRAGSVDMPISQYNIPDVMYLIDPGQVTVDVYGQVLVAGEPDLPGYNICPIFGPHEGVLTYGRTVIEAAASVAADLVDVTNSPIPLAELHQTTPNPPLTAEQSAALVKSWSDARSGGGGKVAYTPSSVQLITHGTPAETALTVGKPLIDVDVARIMGLPASAIDALATTGGLQYGTPESRARDILSTGVMPYLQAIERAFSEWIYPPGQSVKFDTSSIISGDLSTRARAYKLAEDAGIMTPEEARAAEIGPANE